MGWLTESQFVDAVAMELITPGPVVIMATFAGYLIHGVLGAVVATLAVFVPVCSWSSRAHSFAAMKIIPGFADS
jgi:chromate transport protein ChrA